MMVLHDVLVIMYSTVQNQVDDARNLDHLVLTLIQQKKHQQNHVYAYDYANLSDTFSHYLYEIPPSYSLQDVFDLLVMILLGHLREREGGRERERERERSGERKGKRVIEGLKVIRDR